MIEKRSISAYLSVSKYSFTCEISHLTINEYTKVAFLFSSFSVIEMHL